MNRELLCLQCSIPDACDESDLRCKYQQAIRRERAARRAATHAARTEQQRAAHVRRVLHRCAWIVRTQPAPVFPGFALRTPTGE